MESGSVELLNFEKDSGMESSVGTSKDETPERKTVRSVFRLIYCVNIY